jgi:hypothetical protein
MSRRTLIILFLLITSIMGLIVLTQTVRFNDWNVQALIITLGIVTFAAGFGSLVIYLIKPEPLWEK